MTPKTVEELDELLDSIHEEWAFNRRPRELPGTTWPVYLRRKLADAGVQMVPEHWAHWHGPEEGPEISPFYTEPS